MRILLLATALATVSTDTAAQDLSGVWLLQDTGSHEWLGHSTGR
jgi:hypothetical protein